MLTADVPEMPVQGWKRMMQLFETMSDRSFEERRLVERGLQSGIAAAEEPDSAAAAGSETSIPCTAAVVVELGSLAAALDWDSLCTVVEVEHPGIRWVEPGLVAKRRIAHTGAGQDGHCWLRPGRSSNWNTLAGRPKE